MVASLQVLSVIITLGLPGLLIMWYSVVSSAYLSVSMLGHRSLTKQFHKTRPIILSSGTPTEFCWYDDRLWLQYFTRCLSVRKLLTTNISGGLTTSFKRF